MKLLQAGLVLAMMAVLGLQSAPGWSEAKAQTAASSQKTLQDADRAFIDLMVPHHQMGIEMANEAIAKAQHKELKAFAQRMRDIQRKEVEQMKSWRQKWFGSAETPAPMPMAPMPAGKDFDRMWMTQVIDHHQQAIDMSVLTLKGASKAEVKDMANRLIKEQQKEQSQLSSWLKSWYGK